MFARREPQMSLQVQGYKSVDQYILMMDLASVL
jgi:hypothetical protein